MPEINSVFTLILEVNSKSIFFKISFFVVDYFLALVLAETNTYHSYVGEYYLLILSFPSYASIDSS